MARLLLSAAGGPQGCDCHAQFDRTSREIAAGVRTAPSRRRDRPKQVDALGEHDQRCPRSFTLVRHDHVQDTVRGELRYGGKNAKPATVHELRSRDMRDTSMTKGDLRATNMSTDGLPTVIDFGITHSLLDTYIRAIKSKVERRPTAALHSLSRLRSSAWQLPHAPPG